MRERPRTLSERRRKCKPRLALKGPLATPIGKGLPVPSGVDLRCPACGQQATFELLGLQSGAADRSVWNPDWGIDLERTPVIAHRVCVIAVTLIARESQR